MALGAQGAEPAKPKNPWSASASLSFKETFDSNVYIQEATPGSAGVAAARAAGLEPVQPKQESFVSTVLPRFGLDYKPSAAFNASASYAPEITYYHAESSEDYLAHRGTLNLGGKIQETTWELLNTATYIDGNDLGPTFARPGDIPAIGGIPLRDRREAFIFCNGFKLTYPVGDFFLRPVATTYFHDFQTQQRLNPSVQSALFVYENYIDRRDLNGGLDAGLKVAENTHLILGYRYGHQDQFRGPNRANSAFTDSPFDSAYHRALVGLEGTPADWVKLAVLGGPEFRDFDKSVRVSYPEFDRHEVLYWIDATVTFLPTKRDTITLLNRRFEQPAFSSHSVYEDVTYDITWRHKFDDRWTASAGFRLYIGDWQAPVNREDWIYTPSVSLAYTHDKHWNAEIAYSCDWVENKAGVAPGQTAFAAGREFTRHLVSLVARYTF